MGRTGVCGQRVGVCDLQLEQVQVTNVQDVVMGGNC